jgi:hypothetical protein
VNLPPRTLDTMTEAIALSSPSGRQSKAGRDAATKRLGEALFGPLDQRQSAPEPTATERAKQLRRTAADLRQFAARGVKPRASLKRAIELEAQADEMERSGK